MIKMLKKLLRKLNTPKIRERNEITFGFAAWFLNVMSYGALALIIIGYLFKASITFMGDSHNVDLALNMANIGCGFCLKDIIDEGTLWSGQHNNVTLKDSYIDSSHNMMVLFYYSNIGSFILGVSVSV